MNIDKLTKNLDRNLMSIFVKLNLPKVKIVIVRVTMVSNSEAFKVTILKIIFMLPQAFV